MFVIHETLSKKHFDKIMQCPSIKSPPFSYGNDLFLKKKNYNFLNILFE
jgi:hypothetical protein